MLGVLRGAGGSSLSMVLQAHLGGRCGELGQLNRRVPDWEACKRRSKGCRAAEQHVEQTPGWDCNHSPANYTTVKLSPPSVAPARLRCG